MALTFDPRCKERLRGEYTTLYHFNRPLCKILEGLAEYVFSISRKDVMITCVCRNQAQNDKAYECLKESARPKPRKTAHSVYAAIDIRSRGLEEHIPAMLSWLNAYDSSNANPIKSGRTAFFHDMGHGPHFHIQYQLKKAKPKSVQSHPSKK